MKTPRLPSDQAILKKLIKQSYRFFAREMDAKTGLMPDKTTADSKLSIASQGFAFSTYPAAVEYGFLTRKEAARRTLLALRTLADAPQGASGTTAGDKGFFYHFLEPKTIARAEGSELSTIDTAILMAGALTAKQYFDGAGAETKIRDLVDQLYSAVDWKWALNGGSTLSKGWKPETGFIKHRWNDGYSEAHILYILGLGAPNSRKALTKENYEAWIRTFEWKTYADIDYLYAGPLFIHQMSQSWLDLRGLKDAKISQHGLDYFQNSSRAVRVQIEYAIKNPHRFAGYSSQTWGLTACEGPGDLTKFIHQKKRTFYGYHARGAPFGADDGTLSPWIIAACLPFAPIECFSALRFAQKNLHLQAKNNYGFETSYNPTFNGKARYWVSNAHYGINQGPVVMMGANYDSDLIWRLMRECAPIKKGLKKAGFRGGWLEHSR
jgi:hypothetical protein